MTLTQTRVREFEADQKTYGTEVALFNLLYLKAAADLAAIGVTRVTTARDAAR